MGKNLKICALILSAIMLLGGLMGCVKLEETDIKYKISADEVKSMSFLDKGVAPGFSSEGSVVASFTSYLIEDDTEEALEAKEEVLSYIDAEVLFLKKDTTLAKEIEKRDERYDWLSCPQLFVDILGENRRYEFYFFDGKIFKCCYTLVYDEESDCYVIDEEAPSNFFESVGFRYTAEESVAFLLGIFGEWETDEYKL